MKKVSFILICLILDIQFLNGQTFKAGAAKVNITPGIGTIINGDFLPMYAKVINDSLYSKALVFENGKTKFVFVVVDITSIDQELDILTKSLITKTLGLSPNQVMISATHAHSCGSINSFGGTPADLNYREALPLKIANSIKLAMSNLQAAKIAWGHFDEPSHPSCRRWFMKPGFPMISPFGDIDKVWMNPPLGSPYLDFPASPTDPQVSFIAIKSLTDKWISIMANYSIHYAADVPPNTISADYFGEVAKNLKEKLNTGNDFVGIVSNGTSGDVNTFDFKLERNYPLEPLGKTKLIGSDVANGIIKTLKGLEWDSNPTLKFKFANIKLDERPISSKKLIESENIVKNTDYNSLNTIDKASDAMKSFYALELLRLSQYPKQSVVANIQAVKIGKGVIGSLPGEFFSETGLDLKKNSNLDFYFSIGLANGCLSYIAPKAQFELGGYETWQCSGSHLAIDSEEKIRKGLAQLINLVKAK